MRNKVTFTSNDLQLSGLLETPESDVRCYALFAHCFTCGKDIAAASRIARALTAQGIAVLRFDFTGLGNSDGDFANTNFSSNIQDLLSATDFLRDHYEAPKLLIGHSLGGAAVLAIAKQVPEATAVVTIGSPHRADHVAHNFSASLAEIQTQGIAEVTLGVRKFNIKKQFLDDLERYQASDIACIKKALLIMHSPLDTIVPIAEAEKIYLEAKHPKSFVSLNEADHLLSKPIDSEYVAVTIAGWVSRYIPKATKQQKEGINKGHVVVEEKNHKFAQHVSSDSHYWLADEPTAVGGDNTGPDPYEHLLAALGTCTSMTIRLYAERKAIPLDHVRIELSHKKEYIKDCQTCDDKPTAIDEITRKITLTGNLDQDQKAKLMAIADKCPVHKTLHNEIRVTSMLMDL